MKSVFQKALIKNFLLSLLGAHFILILLILISEWMELGRLNEELSPSEVFFFTGTKFLMVYFLAMPVIWIISMRFWVFLSANIFENLTLLGIKPRFLLVRLGILFSLFYLSALIPLSLYQHESNFAYSNKILSKFGRWKNNFSQIVKNQNYYYGENHFYEFHMDTKESLKILEINSKTGKKTKYRKISPKKLPQHFPVKLKTLLINFKDRHINTYSWNELFDNLSRKTFYGEWIIRIETIISGFLLFLLSILFSILYMHKKEKNNLLLYALILIKILSFQLFHSLRNEPSLLIPMATLFISAISFSGAFWLISPKNR